MFFLLCMNIYQNYDTIKCAFICIVIMPGPCVILLYICLLFSGRRFATLTDKTAAINSNRGMLIVLSGVTLLFAMTSEQ